MGAETYGLVIYAQAVVMYFVILISFGFNLSGVKLVSLYRENKEKLGEIISSIFIIKFYLFIISFTMMVGILFVLPIAEENKIFSSLHECSYKRVVFSNLVFPRY